MKKLIVASLLAGGLVTSGIALAQSGSVLEGQSTSDRLARDVQDINRVGGNNANGRQSSSDREKRTNDRHGETRTSSSAKNDSNRSRGKPE